MDEVNVPRDGLIPVKIADELSHFLRFNEATDWHISEFSLAVNEG